MDEKTKVQAIFVVICFKRGDKMARIIENQSGQRRIIKMSTDDIISVVKDYQRIVPRFSTETDARDYLEDIVIYIPED